MTTATIARTAFGRTGPYRAGSISRRPWAVLEHPVDPAQTPPRRMPGPGGIADLLETATTEVLAMSTFSTTNAAFRYLGGHAVRSGVRFRTIFPDSARTAPKQCRHLATLALAGADVRTMPTVPMDAIIVDGQIALLPAERSASGVAALELSSVVTATRHLFDRLWPDAVPFADTDLPADLELTPRERETLELLAAGATDEVVAAQLGVAVRTVRRTVAVLMNRLGARSRFQAGVKAAGQGWLPERAR